MAKYLLLKHYRGAPAAVNDVPMDRWTPEEISAHMQYMRDFAARLEGTGEFVDGQALAPEGTFVRYDGEGRPPITDGPFAETKDLIAGWMVIDVESYERAVELAAGLPAYESAAEQWLATQSESGYYVGDFAGSVAQAASSVWSGWGFPSFSIEVSYANVVIPGLAAGKSLADLTTEWQQEMENQAQVQGYTVE
jgi:hypothetical protein